MDGGGVSGGRWGGGRVAGGSVGADGGADCAGEGGGASRAGERDEEWEYYGCGVEFGVGGGWEWGGGDEGV